MSSGGIQAENWPKMAISQRLDSEMRAALEVARGRGGKLSRSRTTLGLYGPQDFNAETEDLAILFGEGTIKALVRHGLMSFDPGDARVVVVADGAQA